MKKQLIAAFAATGLAFGLVSPASAAVTIDSDGKGFVGKGDVQVPFGWSNSQLQINASTVSFSVSSVSETDTTWTCSRFNPQGTEQTQERERTTTTTTQGVLSSVARDGKKQITGFNLSGFGTRTETTATDGPPLGSCPNGWTASTPVTGDPVVISGGTYASHNGVTHKIA